MSIHCQWLNYILAKKYVYLQKYQFTIIILSKIVQFGYTQLALGMVIIEFIIVGSS